MGLVGSDRSESPLLATYRFENPAKPPLLILHGLFGSADNWFGPAKSLATIADVHLMDLPNHGASPQVVWSDYPRIAQAVLRTLDSLQLERVSLVGHSMGGKVAMYLALTVPQRVDHLVVVDIAPKTYPRSHDAIFAALAAVDTAAEAAFDGGGAGMRSRSAADAVMQPFVADRLVRAFLLKSLVEDNGRYRWRLNHRILAAEYAQILGWPTDIPQSTGFGGPTLFVKGEKSAYISRNDGTVINPLFPVWRTAVVPNAGHWVQADNRDGFLEVLHSFLRSTHHAQP